VSTSVLARVVGAALLGLAGAGCASRQPGPVDFSEAAHEYHARDYDQVREHWTRHGKLVLLDEGTVLELWATCKSWDFRQAYIEQYAHTYALSTQAREDLKRAQLEASRTVYEFHVTAESTNYKWNDLQSKDSPWKVTLLDATGAEIRATAIDVQKYPELYEIKFFPARTDFSRTYIIRFEKASGEPDAQPFAGSASGRLTLRVLGPLGRTELVWDTRERP
jgi:hypothetical protein